MVVVPNLAELQVNPNAGRTAVEHGIAYESTSAGIFQSARALQRVARLGNEGLKIAGHAPLEAITDLEAKLTTCWAMLGPFRLPGMIKDTVQSLKALKEKNLNPADRSRRIDVAIRDTTETTELAANVIGMLGKTKVLAPLATTAGLIADTFDLKIAATDLNMAVKSAKKAAQENADPKVQKNLQDFKRHTIIRIAKAICALVGGIFGMALLLFGGPIIPAILLIAIALSATILSIVGHFYKETRDHKMPNLIEKRPLRLLPALAAV